MFATAMALGAAVSAALTITTRTTPSQAQAQPAFDAWDGGATARDRASMPRLDAALSDAAMDARGASDQREHSPSRGGSVRDRGDRVDATPRCPADMVSVRGVYCNEVYEPCERWADNDRDQCLAFTPRPHCTGQRVPMSFCMDRYEWPNREGALPSVMVSFVEAESLCAAQGKRLCTEDEWTFACSGEALLPYPYGRERSADACTIDLFARAPNKPLLHSSDRATREAEVARTYMATPSGSRPRCVSPFAVHDMTGNVDEWVRSTADWGQRSGLMGGFWGHVRNRCRAVTRAHGPLFRYYQIGFRCCSDRPAARTTPRGGV